MIPDRNDKNHSSPSYRQKKDYPPPKKKQQQPNAIYLSLNYAHKP